MIINAFIHSIVCMESSSHAYSVYGDKFSTLSGHKFPEELINAAEISDGALFIKLKETMTIQKPQTLNGFIKMKWNGGSDSQPIDIGKIEINGRKAYMASGGSIVTESCETIVEIPEDAMGPAWISQEKKEKDKLMIEIPMFTPAECRLLSSFIEQIHISVYNGEERIYCTGIDINGQKNDRLIQAINCKEKCVYDNNIIIHDDVPIKLYSKMFPADESSTQYKEQKSIPYKFKNIEYSVHKPDTEKIVIVCKYNIEDTDAKNPLELLKNQGHLADLPYDPVLYNGWEPAPVLPPNIYHREKDKDGKITEHTNDLYRNNLSVILLVDTIMNGESSDFTFSDDQRKNKIMEGGKEAILFPVNQITLTKYDTKSNTIQKQYILKLIDNKNQEEAKDENSD